MNPMNASNPTNPARTHYETLLAPVYRWMLGDFESALARSRAELESLGVARALPGARALDLGAGLGLQAIPLFDLGYRVTAVDWSTELLAELAATRAGVRVVQADMLDAGAWGHGPYDVVVCMGDSLVHLPSPQAVEGLLNDACRALSPDGLVAVTFRDYVSTELEAAARFILVRADDRRILTCCLDYEPDRVRVTDVLHERRGAAWTMRASAYPKLRLSREWVAARLAAGGASVVRASTEGGRITVVARR
jgi:2-polyprenyl-3-methyl-5-hydroxy-6-metoxy-1,4-benzoquinol methylase